MKIEIWDQRIHIVPETKFERQFLDMYATNGVEGSLTEIGTYPTDITHLILHKKRNNDITIQINNM